MANGGGDSAQKLPGKKVRNHQVCVIEAGEGGNGEHGDNSRWPINMSVEDAIYTSFHFAHMNWLCTSHGSWWVLRS